MDKDKENNIIPLWNKYILTVEEASDYYHIGTKKLRCLVMEHPNGDFYLMNGNRLMIKRENFEKFLSAVSSI